MAIGVSPVPVNAVRLPVVEPPCRLSTPDAASALVTPLAHQVGPREGVSPNLCCHVFRSFPTTPFGLLRPELAGNGLGFRPTLAGLAVAGNVICSTLMLGIVLRAQIAATAAGVGCTVPPDTVVDTVIPRKLPTSLASALAVRHDCHRSFLPTTTPDAAIIGGCAGTCQEGNRESFDDSRLTAQPTRRKI